MAIENLGLVFAANVATALTKTGGNSVRIDGGVTGGDPYIRWRTMSDKAVNASATVTLEWVGVKKATAAQPATVYGTKWTSASFTLTTPNTGDTSSANSRVISSNGGYEWAIKLSSVAGLSNFTSSNWKFDSRKYDELHFRISVYTTFASGVTGADGETTSPIAQSDAWIGYIPAYSISSISYDLDSLDIRLSRSATWYRSDDRWCVESLTIDGKNALPSNQSTWGTVKNATSLVPLKSLKQTPKATSSVKATVRINAAYKAIGYNLATATATKTIVDETSTNTPTVTTTVSGDTILVNVQDGGDRSKVATRATVALVGSGYACDHVEVTVPGTARFLCLPKGTHTFAVIATDNDSGTDPSRTVEVEATLTEDTAKVYAIDGSLSMEVEFDPSYSWSGATEHESVKLAGRERESVFFGVGGSATGTVNLTILGDSAQANAERLAFCKTCLLKDHNGTRKLVAVESVNSTMVNYGATVALSYREVV